MKLQSIIIMLLLIVLTIIPVNASQNDDISASVELNLCYLYDNKPIIGATFDLFKICEYDSFGNFVVHDGFKHYSEDIFAYLDGEPDDSLAQQLSESVSSENLVAQGKTDFEGKVVFPTGDTVLSQGLYLVVGQKLELNGYIYETVPFLVMLPTYDGEGNEPVNDVAIDVKTKRSPKLSDYKVIKVWDDDCHQSQRPKSITVQLLCDGSPYGEAVTLPNNGKWEYIWNDLDTNCEWSVVESLVSGYEKPEIRQEGTTFIITNKCNKEDIATEQEGYLPQTGQLWWPVILLSFAGIVLLVVGIFRRKNS